MYGVPHRTRKEFVKPQPHAALIFTDRACGHTSTVDGSAKSRSNRSPVGDCTTFSGQRRSVRVAYSLVIAAGGTDARATLGVDIVAGEDVEMV